MSAAQTPPQPAYDALKALFLRRHILSQASGILGWDAQVMMPDGAAAARGETLAALSGLSHEMLTAPAVAELLDRAEQEAGSGGSDDWDTANLALMRRAHRAATALPTALVEAETAAAQKGEMVWRKARRDNDFAAMLPAMREIVGIQKEVGQARGEALGLSVYDALLDQFEPGGSAEKLDTLFAELASFLPDLVENALTAQNAQPEAPAPKGPFHASVQEALGREMMAALGFDFERGRLDISLHPFCGGADDDVRITTRYDDTDYLTSLLGVLHETGHALYEQGLPAAWRGQPVGSAAGLGMHESQSLFVEMQISRSPAFQSFAAPKIRAAFGGSAEDPAWSLDALGARSRRVERGLIRVDADELTYPAHIVLRYRLERAILSGDLDLADLPGAWREGMLELVGVAPPDDRTGCLQDIHWPSGAWGYFPTYTLGAMAAAQLAAAARRAIPDIDAKLARGDLAPVVAWLRENVHSQGSIGDTDAILTRATGAPLGVTAYRAHLEARYLGN